MENRFPSIWAAIAGTARCARVAAASATSGEALRSFTVDDPPGSGTDHGAGNGRISGGSEAVRGWQGPGQLGSHHPTECSRGGRQRLGGLSKQGNPLLRFLWCEGAIHAVHRDPKLQHFYRRKWIQKGLGKARVAAARKLGIRLWIMLRDHIDYDEFGRRGPQCQRNGGACAGMPEPRYGAKQSPSD
jgi:hypothetical protein